MEIKKGYIITDGETSVELEKLIADLLTVLKTNFNYGEEKMTVSISFPSSRFAKEEK